MPTYSLKDDKDGERRRRAAAEEQEAGWTEVARFTKQTDPFRNVITAHPSRPDSREMLKDESLLDLNMLQTGHGSFHSMRPTVELVQTSLAKDPPMPTLNGEVCYEGIMGGSLEDVQRFLFWTSLTDGSAGHTYGAQGIWAMNSRDDPFVGWTSSWGDDFWQDAMHRPGSTQVGIGKRFLERYPWWLFAPRREPEAERAGRLSAFATGIPGAVAIFYLAANWVEDALRGVQGCRIRIEPEAKYEARFFSPATAAETRSYHVRGGIQVDLGRVLPDEDGFWAVPPKPSMADWVLVLEAPDAFGRASPVEPRG